MHFILEKRFPTLTEYHDLRMSVEWPTFTDAQVTLALSKTLYAACVLCDNETIAMGRVLGDGAIYFHIQDVIVNPKYQKMGVGELLMNDLMEFVTNTGGKNTNIGLMCSKGREDFYKGFGFVERPGEKFGAGMIRIL
jgi:ribosomal protein S18 acetylase RimI-like enzyme